MFTMGYAHYELCSPAALSCSPETNTLHNSPNLKQKWLSILRATPEVRLHYSLARMNQAFEL